MTEDPGKPHIPPQKSSAGSRRLYSHGNDFFSVYAITPCLSSENDLPPQNSRVGFTIIIENPQFQRKSADLRKTDCSPANHRSPHPLTHNCPRSTQPTAAPIVATAPLKHKRRPGLLPTARVSFDAGRFTFTGVLARYRENLEDCFYR